MLLVWKLSAYLIVTWTAAVSDKDSHLLDRPSRRLLWHHNTPAVWASVILEIAMD